GRNGSGAAAQARRSAGEHVGVRLEGIGQQGVSLERRGFLGVLGLAAAGVATGGEASSAGETSAVQFVDALPLYVPEQKASGTITLRGPDSSKRDLLGTLAHGGR